MSSANIQRGLEQLGLSSIFQRFLDEKIEDDMFHHLNDSDLNRLGVETIGDRLRLKATMRRLTATPTDPNTVQLRSPMSSTDSSDVLRGKFTPFEKNKQSIKQPNTI